jgi:hypothetical protein
MESVEVRFGRGDKRRTIGYLVVRADGQMRYVKAQSSPIFWRVTP